MTDNFKPGSAAEYQQTGLSPQEITEAANTAVFRAANAPVDYAKYYSIKAPRRKRPFDPEESAEKVMGEADYEAQKRLKKVTVPITAAADADRHIPPPPPKRAPDDTDLTKYSFKTFAARAEMGVSESPEKLRREATQDVFDELIAMPPPLPHPQRSNSAPPTAEPPALPDITPQDALNSFVPLADSSIPSRWDGADGFGGRDTMPASPLNATYPDNDFTSAQRTSPARRFSPRDVQRRRQQGPPVEQVSPSLGSQQAQPARRSGSRAGALLAAVILLAVAVGALWMFSGYTLIAGNVVKCDVTSLDLTGQDVNSSMGIVRCKSLKTLVLTGCGISTGQYDRIARALPDCDVIWDVPLTDTMSVSSTLTTLDLSGLWIADAKKLADRLTYLPQLQSVTMEDCGLSDQQLTEIDSRISGYVIWSVTLGDAEYTTDCTILDLTGNKGLSFDQIKEKMSCFSLLEGIDLTDCGFEKDALLAFSKEVTASDIMWTVYICGAPVKTNVTQLSLSGGEQTQSSIPELSDDGVLDISTIESETGYGERKQYTPVDISELRYCSKLTTLEIDRCGVVNIGVLAELPELQSICLSDNMITDLTPLQGLSGLRYLDLSKNNIDDIAPLSELTSLEYLDLSGNNISSLAPLADLKQMRELACRSNNISDVTPLAALDGIKKLCLSDNSIIDPRPLTSIKQLEYLSLTANDTINRAYVSQVETELPDCTIRS